MIRQEQGQADTRFHTSWVWNGASLCFGFVLACSSVHDDDPMIDHIDRNQPAPNWIDFPADQECISYCQSIAPCKPIPNCAHRCGWTKRLSPSAQCNESASLNLACQRQYACQTASHVEAACASAFYDEIEACQDTPLFFFGWEICHQVCDISVRCDHPIEAGWTDCFAQCKFNTSLDWSQGCFEVSMTLSTCIRDIASCQDYHRFYNEHPDRPCQEELQSWLDCVEI